jgi:hypothetical protein
MDFYILNVRSFNWLDQLPNVQITADWKRNFSLGKGLVTYTSKAYAGKQMQWKYQNNFSKPYSTPSSILNVNADSISKPSSWNKMPKFWITKTREDKRVWPSFQRQIIMAPHSSHIKVYLITLASGSQKFHWISNK